MDWLRNLLSTKGTLAVPFSQLSTNRSLFYGLTGEGTNGNSVLVTMSLRTLLLLVIALGIVGCASSVYEYNLQHAYVAPAAGLSQQETEQIIWAVTSKSRRQIISITREPERDRVLVSTSNADEGLMVYYLRKRDGRWRIVDNSQGETMAL